MGTSNVCVARGFCIHTYVWSVCSIKYSLHVFIRPLSWGFLNVDVDVVVDANANVV